MGPRRRVGYGSGSTLPTGIGHFYSNVRPPHAVEGRGSHHYQMALQHAISEMIYPEGLPDAGELSAAILHRQFIMAAFIDGMIALHREDRDGIQVRVLV